MKEIATIRCMAPQGRSAAPHRRRIAGIVETADGLVALMPRPADGQPADDEVEMGTRRLVALRMDRPREFHCPKHGHEIVTPEQCRNAVSRRGKPGSVEVLSAAAQR